MSFLTVKSVSKSYNNTQVFKNLSLEIEEGEIVALVGPNGSGKSTLLSLMAGLLEPDNGSILLSGKKIEGPEKNLVPGHEEIKLVFQDYGLKPSMSVIENIKYQLIDYKEEYIRERIEVVLNICNLQAFKNRKPRELSGGQQQRVALANALSTDPQVLLMDEPFSNLDPFTKTEILEEVKRIVRETGTTIIIVTHDAHDALSLADRIAFLDQGTILQYDSPKNIYNHPLTLKIGHFFGYLSELSPETKKLMGLDPSKIYAIRAENVLDDTEGVNFPIITKSWRGFFQVISLKQNGESPLLMLSKTPIDDSLKDVKVKIDRSKLLAFD